MNAENEKLYNSFQQGIIAENNKEWEQKLKQKIDYN